MHYVPKLLAAIEQDERHERTETTWANAAVALIGLLMCAVFAALYPIWS